MAYNCGYGYGVNAALALSGQDADRAKAQQEEHGFTDMSWGTLKGAKV